MERRQAGRPPRQVAERTKGESPWCIAGATAPPRGGSYRAGWLVGEARRSSALEGAHGRGGDYILPTERLLRYCSRLLGPRRGKGRSALAPPAPRSGGER